MDVESLWVFDLFEARSEPPLSDLRLLLLPVERPECDDLIDAC